ncbi:DsrE/DsrF/DrsH-like family protein [uncultured Thiohalocapsa sp.]|uniref:DsrE/DsrF/DrsH-like family protein n=1 Tax=uncultured Thiohalocapsa sp. TaxID=768990 RepID=UPI003457E672
MMVAPERREPATTQGKKMARRISIICVSGTRERLQMAAMVASVAAASGDDVSVFFSMNALGYFVKGAADTAPAEGPFGTLMEGSPGVPPFKQLFSFAAEMGDAKLLPCSMAIDLLGLEADDLDPELGEPTGLTVFLGESADAQLLTF